MRLKITVQIFCGDEIAMGPGKADLLDAIRAHGSISGAGRAMEMSYRRAWLLVDAMNRCWQSPLVETSAGSSHNGGGARVTPFGENVLANYRILQCDLADGASGPARSALVDAILSEPKISQKA